MTVERENAKSIVEECAKEAFYQGGTDPAAPVETSVPENYRISSCIVCGGTEGHQPFASPLDENPYRKLPKRPCPVEEFEHVLRLSFVLNEHPPVLGKS